MSFSGRFPCRAVTSRDGAGSIGTILGVDISLDQARGVTVVRISGDLDLSTVPRLRTALIDLDRRGHHHLELDLRLVDFLDSAGLGVLLGAVRRARLAGGDAHVVAIAPEPARLLSLLGLGPVFGLPADDRPEGAVP